MGRGLLLDKSLFQDEKKFDPPRIGFSVFSNAPARRLGVKNAEGDDEDD